MNSKIPLALVLAWDRRVIFAALNVVVLVAGLIVGSVMFAHDTPHQKLTRDEILARADKMTDVDKLRRVVIADDDDIRSLENLAALLHRQHVVICFAISGVALGNLLLFSWKEQKP
jgi:hypothetical protein